MVDNKQKVKLSEKVIDNVTRFGPAESYWVKTDRETPWGSYSVFWNVVCIHISRGQQNYLSRLNGGYRIPLKREFAKEEV